MAYHVIGWSAVWESVSSSRTPGMQNILRRNLHDPMSTVGGPNIKPPQDWADDSNLKE